MCASLALQPEVKQMNKDIDFLVDLESGRTLLDLGGLQYDLEQYLLIPVDVATESMLKSRIKERVLKEAVEL
jgi:predicted nucleotidyltransferase